MPIQRIILILLMMEIALHFLLTIIDTDKIYKNLDDGAVQKSMPQVARAKNISGSDGNMFYNVCRYIWNQKPRPKEEQTYKALRKECSCGQGGLESRRKDSLTRRKKELEEWKLDQELRKERSAVNTALSPLSYPGSGLVVEPYMAIPVTPLNLHPIALECLRHGFHNNDIMINLTCSKTLGRIYLSINLHAYKLSTSTEVFGNNTHSLQIILKSTDDVSRLNTDVINNLLSHIHYRSVYYDIFARDIISLKINNFTSEINVLIKRSIMPVLYDPGPNNNIEGKVTIVTKTFERPKSVENLVKSVRKYYPNVTIVIADDSENPSPIRGDNIKYYIMPFAEGWFAGRNLVISQVRTKYFLWVDDDFEFTEGTDLQKFVDKLEDAEERLDVVAGNPGKKDQTSFVKTLAVIDGDESGDCLIRKMGSHRTMKNYPQCHRSDIVINFFMAKTLSARRIGFDPEYKRVAHTEFFIDGLGQLSVAACPDVTCKHARYKPTNYMYYRRRQDDPKDLQNSVDHTVFKNNLKCFRFH